MNTLLINPTTSELIDKINQAVREANFRSSARTVHVDAKALAAKIDGADHGEHIVTGGGVANSYRQRATSSSFAVIWLTVGGEKRVRIYGERVDCPKSAFGRRPPKVLGFTMLQLTNASRIDLLKTDAERAAV